MKPTRFLVCLLMVFVSSSALSQSKGEMRFTSSSKNANKMLRMAWLTIFDAKFKEGNSILRQILKEDPNCAVAHATLFVESPDEREENMRKAESLKMSDDERQFIQGLKAFRAPEGAKYFEPLISKYPKDDLLHLFMMFFHHDQYRAIEVGEELARRSPKLSPVYNLLGYAYMETDDLAQAEANFNKYLSLRPELANPYDSKADFFMHVGKTQEAIALYEKAVSMGMTESRAKADRARSILKFPKLSEADETAIKEMIEASIAAYPRGDMDGILKPYAEQSVEIFANQIANVGLVNARTRVEGMYKHGTFVKHEISFDYLQGNGPIAVAFGRTVGAWKSAESGEEVNLDDNAMFMLRRQKDRTWKILVDHFYFGEGHTQPLSDDDRKQIIRLIKNYEDAIKPGQTFDETAIERFSKVFSAQAVELSANQLATVGIANLQAGWARFDGIRVERNNLGLIGFDGLGRRAVAWGIANRDYYPNGSETLSATEFAWSMLLTKEKDDMWRILAMHWTPE